jgi:hypothetical protein
MPEEPPAKEFVTRSFLHDGDVCVELPENNGFEPGEHIKLIKIGDTIHVLHAWDMEAIRRLSLESEQHDRALRPRVLAQ